MLSKPSLKKSTMQKDLAGHTKQLRGPNVSLELGSPHLKGSSVSEDALEAQSGIVGEGGGKGPNIP